ncbi:Hypothetical protein R9X50_00215700 [Acrodontium crateriforme]|uniref:FAD-binding domain-containing protein n=1 Tax=Acrodontium crateriforme TaxID=150365 RepID=A0AAQ3M0F2_9PEZI|nr:Hypothetical protein R9X50_00215700 [Acrodontium crateriforme]
MNQSVLIIGGGIGGLTLAHGLKKHGIPFHVFERDFTHDYRSQGYRIRVAREAVEALQYLLTDEYWGLFELINAETNVGSIVEIDATSAHVDDPTLGKSHATDSDHQPGPKPYTVDRTLFRGLLLRGLEGSITYGKTFLRYQSTKSGITAFFSDGSSADGTLLVGSDGKHSNVRKQAVPNHKILDVGAHCIYGKTPLTKGLEDAMQPAALERMNVIKDRSRDQILAMVLEPVRFTNREKLRGHGFSTPQDYVYWVMVAPPVLFGMLEDEMPHFTAEDAESLAIRLTEKWHPTVRPMVENQQPGGTQVLSITSCPSVLEPWTPNPSVTLLGDAIHLMGPNGSGAVTAIRDAGFLCGLLVEEGFGIETITKYEAVMRGYAGQTIRISEHALKLMAGQIRGHETHIGQVAMDLRRALGRLNSSNI